MAACVVSNEVMNLLTKFDFTLHLKHLLSKWIQVNSIGSESDWLDSTGSCEFEFFL